MHASLPQKIGGENPWWNFFISVKACLKRLKSTQGDPNAYYSSYIAGRWDHFSIDDLRNLLKNPWDRDTLPETNIAMENPPF